MAADNDEKNNGAALFIAPWLVWVVAFGFALCGLGSFGLSDNNEGLYAEIAREMLASRDWHQWMVPSLNGLPYLEKPPLLYWLTALSFALFGPSEWSARLVPALSALSCVAMLLRFGRAVRQVQAGRLAALIFISGVGMIVMSHVLMFDMLLTALLAAALMFAYRYRSEERAALLRWSYAFLALAVLTKGFVAVALYGLVMAAFIFAAARAGDDAKRVSGKWCEPGALLVFLIIVLPWHVAVILAEPIFAWLYFVNEQVLRFLGMRQPHDYYSGAWWYYLPRMAIYLFPWSFLLPGMLASPRLPRPTEKHLERFLAAAWLVPLAFFTLSSAKANYYLVIVMPFAAFHLALAIEARGLLRPFARTLPGLLIAAMAVVLGGVLAVRGSASLRAFAIDGLTQRQFLCLLLAGLALLALVAAAVSRSPRIGIMAYLVLPAWIAAGMMLELRAMEPEISTRTLSHYLQRVLPDREVYVYRNFEAQSSLPFYMKRPIPVVDAQSNELFWGNRLQANRIIVSSEIFRATLRQRPVAIVVVERQLENFHATGLDALFKCEKTIGDTTVFFN
jgi:4-amino-4-deoxy-L-arabinose transferase-like glycosyltransferase